MHYAPSYFPLKPSTPRCSAFFHVRGVSQGSPKLIKAQYGRAVNSTAVKERRKRKEKEKERETEKETEQTESEFVARRTLSVGTAGSVKGTGQHGRLCQETC